MSRKPLSKTAFLARMAKGRAAAAAKRGGRPAKTARKDKAKRVSGKSTRRVPSALSVDQFGWLHEVQYRHTGTGRMMRHVFKTPARLCFPADRRALIVPSVRIVARDGQPYIGD